MERSPERDPLQPEVKSSTSTSTDQSIGSARIKDRFVYNLVKGTVIAGVSVAAITALVDILSNGGMSELIRSNSNNALLLLFTVASAGPAIAIIEHAKRN